MKLPGWKHLAWIAGGGVAGFAWYYFVGCATGSCPISSNPYVSTAYGVLVGTLASWNRSKPAKKATAKEPAARE
jgi:hypothetical protein